jgi:MoaA/NifB/PqqE/SkfB family radical SAM enzyme
MRRAGAKTVEWTGGGDPTKYPLIKMFIRKAHELGYEQGFITNGIELSSKVGSYIEYLKWIRISLNSLDYVEDIEMPVNYKGTLGFSYVMNDMTDNKIIAKVMKYTKMYRPKYVRIVPNCQTSPEELDSTNKRLSKVVASWGAPFFYQMKTFHRPERCWWGYFKPFILHDGYVYRCSSVVLNDSAERSFHRKFRWMTMEDFIGIDYKKAVPYDCKHCSNCVFSNQNELIDSLLNDEMENFV